MQNSRWLDQYWGGPFLRACFFLRFEVKKRPRLRHCFAPISIALRPSRPASKPALTCFVLISMVSRHWSSRLALRSASNFVSFYNFWVCCNFHNLEASRLALRPSLCPSCGLNSSEAAQAPTSSSALLGLQQKGLQLFSAANMYFFCLTAFSASNTCFSPHVFFSASWLVFFTSSFSWFPEKCGRLFKIWQIVCEGTRIIWSCGICIQKFCL